MTLYSQTISIYAAAWVPMVFIAIANGATREIIFSKFMKELPAHQLSCVTGVILFYFYTFFLQKHFPLHSSEEAISIGFMWLTLTISFEFVFGHYIMGNSWAKLFADYNIFKGKLWFFVLVALIMLPLLVFIENNTNQL
ncbi:MAG: hypothetical protein BA863_05805 [Desulfovibrio sp. S3730MH75]|nr:MAG: hypothetical protein BA863_05805 [Desulfovibrio sp. S3730MH75]